MDEERRPQTDEPTKDAGTGDQAWWWSPGLMVVVGVVVVGFQVQAYTAGGGTVLNAIMIAIGVAVAATGLVQLWRARPR